MSATASKLCHNEVWSYSHFYNILSFCTTQEQLSVSILLFFRHTLTRWAMHMSDVSPCLGWPLNCGCSYFNGDPEWHVVTGAANSALPGNCPLQYTLNLATVRQQNSLKTDRQSFLLCHGFSFWTIKFFILEVGLGWKTSVRPTLYLPFCYL